MAIAGQYALETDPRFLPATMQAAVYRGVNDVRMETVPVPKIGSAEKCSSAFTAAAFAAPT